MREFYKRAFQPGDVMAIRAHVIRVDIRDNGHHGQQIKKRRVRLVGLDHYVLALAQPGVGTGGIKSSAYDESRVQVAAGQNSCDQAGSRGLAMRRSEEHTSELQSLMRISYAVFCLKTKYKHI